MLSFLPSLVPIDFLVLFAVAGLPSGIAGSNSASGRFYSRREGRKGGKSVVDNDSRTHFALHEVYDK